MFQSFEYGKYHTFGLTIYYEVNKPKKGFLFFLKDEKKTQECLNNIRIRFPTYENECYARRTRILRTMRWMMAISIMKEIYVFLYR